MKFDHESIKMKNNYRLFLLDETYRFQIKNAIFEIIGSVYNAIMHINFQIVIWFSETLSQNLLEVRINFVCFQNSRS